MSSPARLCRGCSQELPPKHLRTQLAPPDNKWHEVRTHDLDCLLDFLEREEVQPNPVDNEIFSRLEWIRSRG